MPLNLFNDILSGNELYRKLEQELLYMIKGKIEILLPNIIVDKIFKSYTGYIVIKCRDEEEPEKLDYYSEDVYIKFYVKTLSLSDDELIGIVKKYIRLKYDFSQNEYVKYLSDNKILDYYQRGDDEDDYYEDDYT